MSAQSIYVLTKLKKIIDETTTLIQNDLVKPNETFTTIGEAYSLIVELSSLNEGYERLLIEWLNSSERPTTSSVEQPPIVVPKESQPCQ